MTKGKESDLLNITHKGRDKDKEQFFNTIGAMPSGPNFTLLSSDNNANSTSESVTFILQISTIGVFIFIRFKGFAVLLVQIDLKYEYMYLFNISYKTVTN